MKNKYKEEVEKGRYREEDFEELKFLSRDNSRTPMQWNDYQKQDSPQAFPGSI